jgi:hypothetical protein
MLVLYLCVLIIFLAHRESLKLILVEKSHTEVVLSQLLPNPTPALTDSQPGSSSPLQEVSPKLMEVFRQKLASLCRPGGDNEN